MTEEKKKKYKEINPKKNPILKKNTFFLNFLAWWIITLVFVFVGLITFLEIPKGNEGYVNYALGSIFSTGFGAIIVWAFRTSKGAMEEKNMESQVKTLNGGGVK